MPFAPDFDEVFAQVIRDPLEAEGFKVARADESRGTRNIMHDVINGIASADLVVADLSGGNPNVYYELGIAHAFGKPTILLTQDLDEVPFDLRAYRVITYSTHFARVAEAINALRRTAMGASQGTVHFGSPVSDFKATQPPQLAHALLGAENQKQASIAQPTSEQDDVGLLDCVVDVQEGMTAINSVVTQMGQRFEALNPHINAARIKLEGSAKHEPIQARSAVRELASAMDDYTRWLKPANLEYRQGLARLASGLDNLFAIDLSSFDSSSMEIGQLYSVLATLDSAVQGAHQMVEGLLAVIGGLPRIEKEFNRAKRIFLDEMGVTGENLQRTAAVLSRAKDGAQRLQNAA